METPTKRTEGSVRGTIERSNQRRTTAELEAAVAEDRAFWRSAEGIEARKLQAAKPPKPIKRGIHPTVLAARARQFKA
jgi:hypothetical protein